MARKYFSRPKRERAGVGWRTTQWRDAAAIAALLAVCLVVSIRLIAAGASEVISGWGADGRLQYFAWRHFAGGQLRQGVLPLWNPYIYCGTPFHAGIQGAVLYPLNLPFMLLPTAVGINGSVVFHVFLAGLFTYLLARGLGLMPLPSFVSGATFMLSHPYFFHLFPGHLSNLATMVWTPLVMLVVEALIRKPRAWLAIALAGVLAAQLLAGHPQYFIYSCVGVGVYFAARVIGECRAILWRGLAIRVVIVAGGALLGATLVAAQTLPAIEFAATSARQQIADKELWAGSFSFCPENLLSFLMPDFLGRGTSAEPTVDYWGRNYIWEMSAYVGVLTLMLVVAGMVYRRERRTWAFLAVAAVASALALGKYTPLFRLLLYVPGYTMFRGHSKFIFLVALCLAVLSGFGMSAFLTDGQRLRRFLKVSLWAAIGLAGVAGAVLLIIAHQDGGTWPAWRRLAESYLDVGERQFSVAGISPDQYTELLRQWLGALKASLAATMVILVGVAAVLFMRLAVSAKAATICVLVVLLSELLYHDLHIVKTGSVERIGWPAEAVEKTRSLPGSFRLWWPTTPVSAPSPNDAMIAEVESMEGYDANVIGWYSDYAKTAAGLPLESPNVFMRLTGINSLDMIYALNPVYLMWPTVIGGRAVQPPMRYEEHLWQNSERTHALYRLPAFSRARLVHAAEVVPERINALERLSTRFDFQRTVLLASASSIRAGAHDENEPPAGYRRFSTHRTEIFAVATSPGWLVISDAYYPGWRAYRNGVRVPVLRGNYAFRAVEVPEDGPLRVTVAYDPPSFKAGVATTLWALFVCSALLTSALVVRRVGRTGT